MRRSTLRGIALWSLGAICVSVIFGFPPAQAYEITDCYKISGSSIFGLDVDHYKFIGSVTNKYDADSIANSVNKYVSDSVMSTYGPYGSKYSSTSAWYDYAYSPPILVDSLNDFVGYLTTNTFISPRVDPYVALACAAKTFTFTTYAQKSVVLPKDFPLGIGAIGGATYCPANSFSMGGSCYCTSGYQPNSSGAACEAVSICPANSSSVGIACYCDAGYQPNQAGTSCVKVAQCPAYASSFAGGCYCDVGYEPDPTSNSCNQTLTCPAHSTLSAGVCSCDVGYALEAGQCIDILVPASLAPAANAVGGATSTSAFAGGAVDVAVAITSPSSTKGRTTQKKSLTLSGTIGANVAFVEVNGDTAEIDSTAHTWSARVKLKDGKNKITVTSFDVTRATSDEDRITIVKEPTDSLNSSSSSSGKTSGSSSLEKLRARGVVNNADRPDAFVTRAEFTKMLVLAFGKSPKLGTLPTDVSASHPLAKFVTTAEKLGWASGRDGRFYPDQPISRLEDGHGRVL